MPKSSPVRVQGRAGLRAHLAAAHKEGAGCDRSPDRQLDRGGWARGTSERFHLFGGAAEVAWKYKCPGCKATTVVVTD